MTTTERTKKGGWIQPGEIERSAEGRPLCRWCHNEVEGRRRTFCSDDCVHQWKLRTDPGYLREKVLDRDKGICAICSLDTLAQRRDLRKLDYAARRRLLNDLGLKEGSRKSFWDADHIITVAEGGGQCDLSNIRTLCLRCHSRATTRLRARLASTRALPGVKDGPE